MEKKVCGVLEKIGKEAGTGNFRASEYSVSIMGIVEIPLGSRNHLSASQAALRHPCIGERKVEHVVADLKVLNISLATG